MQVSSSPDPIHEIANRGQSFHSRYGPPLPSTNLSADYARSPYAERLGEHIPAYRTEGVFELRFISFFLGLYGAYLCLMRAWECAAFIGLLVLLNLLAAHYARRPACPHRAARILCAVYFSSVPHPETRQVTRRNLRLLVWPALLVAIFLAMAVYGAWGKPRTPMVDPRIFDRSEYWDYLRENNFFRDPPAPAPARRP